MTRLSEALVTVAAALIIVGGLMWSADRDAQATPAYAQKTGKGCPTCHTSPPNLNQTGKKFQANGHKF